jgi:diguanylate cyclase (GGDEF)-like protein
MDTNLLDDKACILLVDDEPANIQLIAGYIKDDYQIKVATSGEQCLRIANSKDKPDLILLDVEMPIMNGYDVCEQLKREPTTASIPVIFVTAMQTEEDEEKALMLGAVDFLTKPVRPAILIARIKTQIILKKQHDALINLAMRDQLTNLYNRHYLLEMANHRVARAMRKKVPVSVLILDVDHFKKINDTQGHVVGDLVLKSLAELLQQLCRQEDILARFGGEEFLIFFDECDEKNATNIAERMRKDIALLNPAEIPISASVGVAQLKIGEEGFTDLVKRADDAMYHAKKTGRNKVVSHTAFLKSESD